MSSQNDENQKQSNYHIEDATQDAFRIGKKISDYKSGNAASKGAEKATEAGKEAAKNTGKEFAKEAAKESAKAAATETAAAATGPVGQAAKYGIKALRKFGTDFSDMANGGRGDKGKHSSILVIFAIIFLSVNIFSFDQAKTLITPVVSQYSAGLFGEFSDELFYYTAETAIQQLREDGHVVLATFAEVGLSIYKGVKGVLSNVVNFFEGIFSGDSGGDEEDDGDDSIGIAEDIDMDQMFKSSTDADIEVIQKLGFERAIEDAKEVAKLYIAAQPGIDIDISYEIVDAITWEEVYKDVNYAEFLSILNEKEEFSANKTTLKKFKKLFNTKNKRRPLWRIRFDIEEMEIEEPIYDDDFNYLGTETKTIKYIKTTVKQYTLEGLYRFLDVDDEAMHYLYKNTANIDVLDRSESALRIYMPYYEFGPNVRTPWQDDFEEMDVSDFFGMFVTGVTTYKYGMSTDEVWSMLQELLDGKDISDAQKAVIEAALSTIGSAYSQANRDNAGVYDCSSLIARVYAAAGYSIADYSPTAAEECRLMESWGTTVTDTSDLQPGDILFLSYKDDFGNYNGRYKNVSHVAIYVGNGMQVDARGKNYGVVYRTSQDSSASCVSICRPLAYLAE